MIKTKWILVYISVVAGLLIMAQPAHAQTPSPATPTPTIFYCPPTPTGTSIIPTVSIPTADYSTPCPTCTPTPTGTALTATVTPTGTPAPTDCGDGIDFVSQTFAVGPGLNSSNVQNTCYLGSQSTVICRGSYSVAVDHYDGGHVFWHIVITLPQLTGQTIFFDFASTMAGDIPEFFVRDEHYGGALTGGAEAVHDSGSYVSGGFIDLYIQNNIDANSSIQNFSVDYVLRLSLGSACLFDDLTATATPNPDGNCVVGSPGIESELVDFSPPVIIPGECYTIIPNASFDTPNLTWSPVDLPPTIGIPGVDVCIDTISMNMKLLGLDVIGLLSGIVTVMCATIIYKQINS